MCDNSGANTRGAIRLVGGIATRLARIAGLFHFQNRYLNPSLNQRGNAQALRLGYLPELVMIGSGNPQMNAGIAGLSWREFGAH